MSLIRKTYTPKPDAVLGLCPFCLSSQTLKLTSYPVRAAVGFLDLSGNVRIASHLEVV